MVIAWQFIDELILLNHESVDEIIVEALNTFPEPVYIRRDFGQEIPDFSASRLLELIVRCGNSDEKYRNLLTPRHFAATPTACLVSSNPFYSPD